MSSPSAVGAVSSNFYTETNTIIFTYPKRGFQVNISNAPILYQLAIPGINGNDYVWDTLDHRLLPSLTNFRDPAQEGFPGASGFAGFRFKSATPGVPAIVDIN